MIKIDLLPPQLRKKDKIVSKIPMASVVPIIILVMIGLHILFGIVTIYKKVQILALGKTWSGMSSQFKEVSTLKDGIKDKKDKIKDMEFVLNRKFYYTELLSKVNQAIPKRLWLNQLTLSKTGLVIEGSVFSFGDDQVSSVNKFFDVLKNDSFFVKNFRNFNIGSMQRRAIKSYEVLDFILSAENKEEKKVESKSKNKRKR